MKFLSFVFKLSLSLKVRILRMRLCHFSLEDLILIIHYLDSRINELCKNLQLDLPVSTTTSSTKSSKKLTLEDFIILIKYLDTRISELHKFLNDDPFPLEECLESGGLGGLGGLGESDKIGGKRKFDDLPSL